MLHLAFVIPMMQWTFCVGPSDSESGKATVVSSFHLIHAQLRTVVHDKRGSHGFNEKATERSTTFKSVVRPFSFWRNTKDELLAKMKKLTIF